MRISIPSDYGRNMLAVLDETKSLQYGQVFVQYSKSLTDASAGFEILKGPVIVTKNPSLHPGDVRKLIAVDVPALHHIKDCIVFPAKGRRPHPDEIAGSDMDGDEMVVLWYKPLIFERDSFPPMDYPQYKENNVVTNIQLPDMVTFFCQYIQNDNIGIFANAHLVWADRLEEGIFSKKCMGIAKKYPYVLDFAKQGTTQVLEKHERANQYPDFLEKGLGGNTYHSEKVLGALYRTARVLEACSSKIKLTYESLSCDSELKYPGWKHYQKSADGHLHAYKLKMGEILDRYNLRSEAEAFAGIITDKFIHQSASDVNKVLKKYLLTIAYSFKSLFVRELEEECQLEKVGQEERLKRMCRRASAWYMVTYQQKNPQILSFPWVLSDILASIKAKRSSPDTPNALLQNLDCDITKWSNTEKIAKNVKKCFCNNILENIAFEWIAQSGLNIGQKKDALCDACHQRIVGCFETKRHFLCCSQVPDLKCSCEKQCSPAKLLLNFLQFFFTTPLEKSLGCCIMDGCNGFLVQNLQELSLQTYYYVLVTQNIYYFGLTFHTNNLTRNTLPLDMLDEGYGEPIKIIINNDLKNIVENNGEEICSFLQKHSGVKTITLNPVKNSMCLIVHAYGKNWERWNLQKILLETNFTYNLKKNLGLHL